MLRRMWRKGYPRSLIHCWWNCKVVNPLWKLEWRILKKLKIKLPYDPAVPVLSIGPKDFTFYSTDACSARFIAILNCQKMEAI